ncbi:hypothetical protein GQ457_09G023180 [Hibiscus cannabinus]
MSNLEENSVSSTIPTHELSTEESVIPNSEDTQPSLSQPNVVVDDNKSSEYNPSRLKSSVWEHFTKEKINNEWKAICKHCNRKLGGDSKNGTKHLHVHLGRCNKRGQLDIRQQVLVANQKKSDGKLTLKASSFNQDEARVDLAKMIIRHEYPLSIVDHELFRKYCHTLQPLFDMPSRNTIKKDILDMYENGKVKTMLELEANEGRVAITTDMWTSDHQNRGYMAVTAHYVDNSWTLQKRIIRFEYVPTPHTGDVIATRLMKCFLDWNIDRKLMSITVDNCSVNDAVVELLLDRLGRDTLVVDGTLFHMRCCAHILNLIVKDGLSVIGDGIERIRHSVIFWNGTPKRWEKFEEAARQLRISTTKKLCTDVKTRWNSTFLMLQTALSYKDVFLRCVQLHGDPLYKHLPTEDDWTFATKICEKLNLFYEMTEDFSGTNYSTANLYFPHICSIRVALNEWVQDSNATISSMARRMLDKFEKYWSVVNGIMGVATLLDPRYKTDFLECYFEDIYGPDAGYELEKIVQLCRDLVKEYEAKMSSGSEPQVFSTTSHTVVANKGNFKKYDTFISTKKKRKSQVLSQLDRYLDDDVIPRTPNFDILNWWKTIGPQFPILQAIARDIYAIPVSTVASESSFSTGGRLVNPQRNRLHPSTVEALACCQSWLIAEEESISNETSSNHEDDEIDASSNIE